jgi:hypothetical protein
VPHEIVIENTFSQMIFAGMLGILFQIFNIAARVLYFKLKKMFPSIIRLFGISSILLASMLQQGCETVGVQDQRLVSKPNMTFSNSYLYAFQPRLTGQVEPGASSSGGAKAAGCTSCK